MIPSFSIKLSPTEDATNWLDAAKEQEFSGTKWSEVVPSAFKEEFDYLLDLPKIDLETTDTRRQIEDFLTKLYRKNYQKCQDYQRFIQQEFATKFSQACDWVTAVTGYAPLYDHYQVWLTTFPREPYAEDTGDFYVTIGNPDPIATALHEILHQQTKRYWRCSSNSLVYNLSDEDWETLKESLTVVIDDSLKPLIKAADVGYPAHQKFRQLLADEWQKHKDYNRLVEFGAQALLPAENASS